MTNAERARHIREMAKEIEADNDAASFQRALAAVAKGSRNPKKTENKKNRSYCKLC
jgi:hypothetical protein